MLPFDEVVMRLGKEGVSPHEIVRMMSQSLGRLIKSMYRTRSGQYGESKRSMNFVKEELEKLNTPDTNRKD